jgi:cell division protein FtsQ
MKKTNLTKFQKRMGLLSFIILMLCVSVFVTLFSKNKICTLIAIKIFAPPMQSLMNEEMIQQRILDWYPQGLVGLPKKQIDLNELESNLESIKTIRNAEVSISLDGKLLVKIQQKTPLLLIQKSDGNRFYLMEDTSMVDASETLVSSVPLLIGDPNGAMIKKLYTFSKYVNENPFANSLLQQIFVTNQNDIGMIPTMGNFKIILGDHKNLEQKFENIKNFMKHGLNSIGWEKYKVIDVQYSNQVVCK